MSNVSVSIGESQLLVDRQDNQISVDLPSNNISVDLGSNDISINTASDTISINTTIGKDLSYVTYAASECTGTDRTTGRTLDVTGGIGFVVLEKQTLTPGTDYTRNGSTITFNVRVDNRQTIVVFR